VRETRSQPGTARNTTGDVGMNQARHRLPPTLSSAIRPNTIDNEAAVGDGHTPDFVGAPRGIVDSSQAQQRLADPNSPGQNVSESTELDPKSGITDHSMPHDPAEDRAKTKLRTAETDDLGETAMQTENLEDHARTVSDTTSTSSPSPEERRRFTFDTPHPQDIVHDERQDTRGPAMGEPGFRWAVQRPTRVDSDEMSSFSSSSSIFQKRRAQLGIPPIKSPLIPTSQGPASSISGHEDLKDIFPMTIECEYSTKFNGEPVEGSSEVILEFRWCLSESYEDLRRITAQQIEKVRDKNGTGAEEEIYIRHASCRVKGKKHDAAYLKLDSMEDVLYQKAIREICGFIHDFPFEPFTLETYWDYGSVQIMPQIVREVDGTPEVTESFTDMVFKQIRGKMQRKNFLDQFYISRIDLVRLIDVDVIRGIIQGDHTLNGYDAERKENLIKQVQLRPASRLQAICVYLDLDMGFLEHLMDTHQCSDSKLPTPARKCDTRRCYALMQSFCQKMYSFFARTVVEDHDFDKLKDDEVMPIQKVNNGKSLGHGAHGFVYEVSIDPTHHNLSGVSLLPGGELRGTRGDTDHANERILGVLLP